MKISRRRFGGVLAAGAAASFEPHAAAQEATADAVDLSMKVIGVKMNEDRADQVRAAVRNTLRQIQKIRAYPVKRDTGPALSLGIFDA